DYTTFLGGSGNETGFGIVVDGEGSAWVTGQTDSTNFTRTANALQLAYGGNIDAFLTKLNATGAVVYSSYLGGKDIYVGRSIALHGNYDVYVTGETFSTDFPRKNAFQSSLRGPVDAFLSVFNAFGGVSFRYSTYLGGNDPVPSNGDRAFGVAVDPNGIAFLTG